MGIPSSSLIVAVGGVFITFLCVSSCSTIKISNFGEDVPESGNSTGKPEFTSVLPSFNELKNFAVQKLLGAKYWNGETFMKSMLSSLITSTGSIRALDHLQTLKTTLLNQFHKKARELVIGRSMAESRDPHHGHGGIGFPSLEGALLSLAFLTFAVFLIDLIQQLVSRYRTGYAVPLVGRRRRSITDHSHLDDQNNNRFSTLTSNVFSAIENPLFLNNLYEL